MSSRRGTIALMGSGELTSTMVEVHKELLRGLNRKPRAVFLDTPAGFQLNADDLAQRAVKYFRDRVGHPMAIASFKSKTASTAYEVEKACRTLRDAHYLLIGPGSPTYAVSQWHDTPIPEIFIQRIEAGACLVAASAAALTVGRFTLPVYEIYKVGQDLHWVGGLGLLEHFGFPLVVIPHWNNAEGGTHDTRFCYMGEPRFMELESLLPSDVFTLGLDEHTACLLDLETGEGRVRGIGGRARAVPPRNIRRGSGAHFLSNPNRPADPFLSADMSKAAERILRAVRSGEPIVVYGDYDTDGVTATAMLVDFLGSIGASVSAYIPSRFEEGYGLNRPALEGLAAQGAKMVVTVDCGARSVVEAEFARDINLDLIITDHHAPGSEEPPAFAFLNPKRSGCIYPEKNLSGVGVAFRLVQALTQRMGETDRLPPDRYLDLVAVGTVADMVPLTRRKPGPGAGGIEGAERCRTLRPAGRFATAAGRRGHGPRKNHRPGNRVHPRAALECIRPDGHSRHGAGFASRPGSGAGAGARLAAGFPEPGTPIPDQVDRSRSPGPERAIRGLEFRFASVLHHGGEGRI